MSSFRQRLSMAISLSRVLATARSKYRSPGMPLLHRSGMSCWRTGGSSVQLRPAVCSIALAAALLLGLALPLAAQSPEGLLWGQDTANRIEAIALTEDGGRVAIGSRDNTLRVFDESGGLLWPFEAENSILGVDISPDGLWLAVASEDRFVYFLDGEGNQLWQFKAARPMNNAAVASDGSLIAATSDDLTVYALDSEGNLLWQEELGIGVQAVDIYGSGEQARVVIGSDDGLITIYSRTGKALLQTGLDYSVQSVSVTPNGSRILAGSGDGTAVLLNGANGNELWRFEAEDAIVSVALAADGSSALVGSEDGSAYLLAADGSLTHRFRQESDVLSVALAGDGSRLAVGTVAGAARSYDRAAAVTGAARSTAQRQRLLLILVGVVALLTLLAIWAARNTAAGQQIYQRSAAGPVGLLQTMWGARLSYILILPTLALLLTFNYYPAFSGLYHAFTKWSPGVSTEWVGLANFHFLLEDRFFLSGFRNAAILVVVSIAKTMTFPLLVAELIFNVRNRFSQVLVPYALRRANCSAGCGRDPGLEQHLRSRHRPPQREPEALRAGRIHTRLVRRCQRFVGRDHLHRRSVGERIRPAHFSTAALFRFPTRLSMPVSSTEPAPGADFGLSTCPCLWAKSSCC